VDWNAGEYVQPRQFSCNDVNRQGEMSEVVAVINLREKTVTRTRDVMMRICQVIAKGNIFYTYAEAGFVSKTGSCQQFVKNVFTDLGINSHYWEESRGKIYELIQEVKTSKDKIYWPSYQGVKIKSHDQLDKIYNKHFPGNRPTDTEELEFFRAIDRSYWATGDTTSTCPLLGKLDVDLCRSWPKRNFQFTAFIDHRDHATKQFEIKINNNDNYNQLLTDLKAILSKHGLASLFAAPVALKVKKQGVFVDLNDITQMENNCHVLVYSAKANVLAKGLLRTVDLEDERYEEEDDFNDKMT